MSTPPEIKLLAQALYGVRGLLSGYLGSAAAGDVSVRTAAHLSYALHNEALAVLEGRSVDVGAAIAKVKAVDAMFGSNLAEQMAPERTHVATSLDPNPTKIPVETDAVAAGNAPMSPREVTEKYLRECHGAELVTLLTEVLAGRPESSQEPNLAEDVLVLACAYREWADTEAWEPWRLAVIAPAAASMEPGWFIRAGEPFLQQGQCDQCSLEIHSHAKHATCPVCNVRVFCT